MADALRELLAEFTVQVRGLDQVVRANVQVDRLAATARRTDGVLARAGAGLRGFGARIRDAFSGATVGVGGLAAPAGGGALAGLASLRNAAIGLGGGLAIGAVRNFVDQLGDIGEQAAKLGVSSDEIQRLGVLAKQNATSVEALGTAFRTLATNAVNPSKDATAAFSALGVQVKNADGSFRPTQDLFFDTAGALADMTDETQRSALAQKLLGRGAQDLKALLAGGREGIERQRAELAKLPVVSADVIAAADALSDRWEAMTLQLRALLSRALRPLLPVFTFITDKLGGLLEVFADGNALVSALTLGFIALAPAIVTALVALAPAAAMWGALFLVVDELVTTFRGGDSYIRDFIDGLFGVGATQAGFDAVAAAVTAIYDGIALLFSFLRGDTTAEDFANQFLLATNVIQDAFDAMFAWIQGGFESVLGWFGDQIAAIPGKLQALPLVGGLFKDAAAIGGALLGVGGDAVAPGGAPVPATIPVPPTAGGTSTSTSNTTNANGDRVVQITMAPGAPPAAVAGAVSTVLERDRATIGAQYGAFGGI